MWSSAKAWEVHSIFPGPHLSWTLVLGQVQSRRAASCNPAKAGGRGRRHRLILFRGASFTVANASSAAFSIPPYLPKQWSIPMELSELDIKVLQQAGKFYDLGDRLLRKGIAGEDVHELQRYLQSAGHFSSPDGCTGYFGFQTQEAVQAWQSEHGVLSTGVFGRQSRDVFSHLLAIEAQKLRSRKVLSRFFSRDNQFITAAVSQQLHWRPAISNYSIQGFAQCSFVSLLIFVTAFASLALLKKAQLRWRRHIQAQKFRALLEQQKLAEKNQLSLRDRKR